MKHYLMAFCIVFSTLSSSWAGTISLPNSHSHNKNEQQSVNIESKSIEPSSSQKMVLHNNCPSMKASIKPTEQVAGSACISCLDDCQCDSGVCHKSSSSLVDIYSNLLNLQVLVEASIAFVQENLANAPISLEIRPPKFS